MNAVEEAVIEVLLPYKELFTAVVLQQDHEAAATSCFRVYCSCYILFSCLLQLLHLVSVFTAAANLVTDEFLCKHDEF